MATKKNTKKLDADQHNKNVDKWMKEAKAAQKSGDKKKMAELMKNKPGNKIMID